MLRFSSVGSNGFARFGIKNPHHLNRITNYRGGVRL